jgi:hypothetical protein
LSRQSIRRNIGRLRLHRSYTMRELANTLGAHVRTVQEWHKSGMPAIDEQGRPLLFLGEDAKSFLKTRRREARTKLGPDQIYCLKCACGVVPSTDTVSVEVTERRLGRCSKQVIVRAKCPSCNGTAVRLASLESIRKTVWGAKVHRADERLLDNSVPRCNTDFKQG